MNGDWVEDESLTRGEVQERMDSLEPAVVVTKRPSRNKVINEARQQWAAMAGRRGVSAAPLTSEQITKIYMKERATLTPAQQRRVNKKVNHEKGLS